MPDILIRGMDMPIEQPVTLILDPSGRVWLPDIKTNKEYMARELPPHGDLTDRDWLIEMAFSKVEDFGGAFLDTIDIALAPVIIPSNKEVNP